MLNKTIHLSKIVFLAILGGLLFFITSCDPTKKIQRDDIKATERVNAKASLQDIVMDQYFKTHPRDTSRKIVTVPGPVIEIPKLVPVRDAAREQHLLDSITAVQKDCGDAAKKAFDLGFEESEKYYKEHPIKVQCPPSTKEETFDHTAIARANDKILSQGNLLAYKDGQIDQKNERIKALDKKVLIQIIVIVGLAFLLLIAIIIIVKKLLFK